MKLSEPVALNIRFPRLERLLLVPLLVAAAVAFPFVGQASPFPITTVLDVWLGLFAVTALCKGSILPGGVLAVLCVFTLTRIAGALITAAPILDFLQAYRWVAYLFVLVLAVGKEWTNRRGLIRVTWTLILLALCKAVITLVLLGPGERPGLLLENNFELALFCGLAAVVYRFLTGKHQFLMLACLGLLVVLSGSRSGVVAFFVLYVFAVAQSRLKVFAKYLSSLAVLAVAWVVVEVFLSRAGASGAIDRLNFLAVFLDETRNWGPLEWVLGTVAITPLSGAACRSLSYYESLFSSADDGTCYSVILHAFLLRVLFDSGILGLLLAFGGIFVLMRRAKVSRLLSLTLLGIAIANSASVSGPNNPYVLLPILLAILLAPVVPGALTGPHPWPSIRYSRPSRNSSRYPIRSG